ncbi:MAG: S8 family serine peptidase [Candidatus Omnitrophica bacterium]|nr:S8 family serine peptidase [Candidatus Omnitrophota bacterium]
MSMRWRGNVLAVLVGIASLLGAVRVEGWYQPDEEGATQNVTRTVRSRVSRSMRSGMQRSKDTYTPERIIVKYKDSVTECVHCLLQTRRTLRSATTDASDSVDVLHVKYKVKAARPIFRSLSEEALIPGAKTLTALRALREVKRNASLPGAFTSSRALAPTVSMPDLSHVYELTLEKGMDAQQAAAAFAKDPHVEYAQPDYTAKAFWSPNDSFYQSQGTWGQRYDDLWNLKKLGLEQAWNVTRGAGVVVAIVDTGLDYKHPDIARNVWVNPGEDLNRNGRVDRTDLNRIDNDGNGFVNDVRGWNFIAGNSDPMDDNGHGTHVAGTIAAVGNNRTGVIGVAPEAKVMPVKALDATGSGTMSGLASAIVYAAENGAQVINNSWGCYVRCPSNGIIEDAVRFASARGAVVVFAAGNSADNVAFYSPQNMTDSKPIVVAASTEQDTPTSFTNFGSLVDVAAPGGEAARPGSDQLSVYNILSLRAAMTGERDLLVKSRYLRLAGTSMAAPHVSGVAALLRAANATLTMENVRQVLRASADDLSGQTCTAFGAGRINASEALRMAREPLLRAQITNPADSAEIDARIGTVPITGTATGPTFRHYTLSYGPGLAPTQWTTIGSDRVTTPVEGGALGTWSVQDLSRDFYVLKLAATSLTGRQFEACTVVIVTDQPARKIVERGSPMQPFVSDELVAWTDERNDSGDVYLYDLQTGTELRVTDSPLSQVVTGVSGHRVVWEDHYSDVYFCDYNRGSKTCPPQPLQTSRGRQGMPVIDGDQIAWADLAGAPRKRRMVSYDVRSGQTQRYPLVETPLLYLTGLSGNRVVWVGQPRSGPWEIRLGDFAGTLTEHRVAPTSLDPREVRPRISGNRIVWVDWDGSDTEVYLSERAADGSEVKRQALTDDLALQLYADISGDRVVWRDRRNGVSNIYLRDLKRLTEEHLAPSWSGQYDPAIAGNKIVWVEYRSDGAAIYLDELPGN